MNDLNKFLCDCVSFLSYRTSYSQNAFTIQSLNSNRSLNKFSLFLQRTFLQKRKGFLHRIVTGDEKLKSG